MQISSLYSQHTSTNVDFYFTLFKLRKTTLTLFNCLLFSPTDISFGRYSGKSFLEFEGIEIGATLSVTMRFQTESMYGTLLYVSSAKKGVFFIKLYISSGTLQVKLHMHKLCMTLLPLQIMDQRMG